MLLAARAIAAPLTPYLVKDLNPGSAVETSRPDFYQHVTVGDLVFFKAEGPEEGLWRTDGTPAGTHRVYDGSLDRQPGFPMAITGIGSRVFFPVHLANETRLYTTDGTTPGTRFITNISDWSGGAPCGNGKICFAGANTEIGVTDGTAEGTSILLSTAPGVRVGWFWEMAPLAGKAFFNTYDLQYGRCMTIDNFERVICGEMWVTDGTVAGTHLFKDLNPGPWPGGPYEFFPSKRGMLYFRAVEPGTQWSWGGCQVWSSDGTPERTRPLTTKYRFSCNRLAYSFIEVGDYVYYIDAFGEIYQTSGTPETTVLIWPEQADYSRTAFRLSKVNDTLLIETVGGLWAYNGTTSESIAGGSISILGYLPATKLLYFADQSGDLWSTDGTARGTQRQFRLPAARGTVHEYAATPRQLFYISGESELFATDGTEAGTRRLDFTTLVGNSSSPWNLLPFGDKVLFTTENPLWHSVSDGTAEGTFAFAKAASVSLSPMFSHDGHVYYRNIDGALFTTDGTAAGTRPLAAWLGVSYVPEPPVFIGTSAIFAAGFSPYSLMRRDADGTLTFLGMQGLIGNFVPVGNQVSFWSYDDTQNEYSLMLTNGNPGGTKRLASHLQTRGDVMTFANGAFFGAQAKGAQGLSLWTTDLAADGAHAVKAVSADADDEILPLLAWRDLAIFAVGDRDLLKWEGEKVWRSDGTAEGTYPLSDARFLYAVPNGDGLTLIRKVITDEYLGWEIWSSDGTAAGTRLRFSGTGRLMSAPFTLPDGSVMIAHVGAPHVLHIRNTATNAATPVSLAGIGFGDAVYVNGRLFFSGCRGKTGCELWAVALDGSSHAGTATVRVDYAGTAATTDGRAAIFRVSMDTRDAAHPTVVAATADGTLIAGRDYEPFTREIVFEKDHDVILSVPLRPETIGTLSLVLSSPVNATVVKGTATAEIKDGGGKRRVVGH